MSIEKFNRNDIADYYNQTVDHYKIWWHIQECYSLHYGYWLPNTRNFKESLLNTNLVMAKKADIKNEMHILDAGCGVGGAAMFLAKNYQCKVSGITLSEKQWILANENIANAGLKDKVDISIQNYEHTNFPDNTFDIVWFCESSCYALDKERLLQEANRLLKKGGKIVLVDYFLSGKIDKNNYMKNWGELWAISNFNSDENFTQYAPKYNLKCIVDEDCTSNIKKSAYRMYKSYWLGIVPSIVYNLFHNTSPWGKYHYKSGYYQYKALMNGLWKYKLQVYEKL